LLDPEKLFASWFFGNRDRSLRLTYVRTCQLLVLAFPHSTLYNMMEAFLDDFVRRNFRQLTSDGRDELGLLWKEVVSSRKSFTQILRMYIYQDRFFDVIGHSCFKMNSIPRNPNDMNVFKNSDYFEQSAEHDVHKRFLNGDTVHLHRPDNALGRLASAGISTIADAMGILPRNWRKKFRNDKLRADLKSNSRRGYTPLLVGVETNPGPVRGPPVPLRKPSQKTMRRAARKIDQTVKKRAKRAAKSVVKKSSQSYIMPATKLPRQGILTQSFKQGKGMKYQENRIAGSGMVVSGLVASDDKKVGAYVYTVGLSPLLFGVAKLSQLANFYQKFWINSLTFRLSTGLPQNEQGSIGGFWNAEPGDLISSQPQNQRLNSAIQRPGWKSFNVWKNDISWSMPKALTKPMLDGKVAHELYYIDSNNERDIGLTQAGNFNIIVDNVLGSNAQTSLGNLYMDWDITVYMQQDDVPQVPNVNQGVLHLMSTTAITTNLPFGTVTATTFNNTGLSPTVSNIGGSLYSTLNNFPKGKTRVFIASTMVGTVVDAKSYILPYDNSSLPGNTIAQVSVQNIVNAGATACVSYAVYDITMVTNYLFFKFSTAATSYTSSDMYLWYAPTGFLKPKEEKVEDRLLRIEKMFRDIRVDVPENPMFIEEKSVPMKLEEKKSKLVDPISPTISDRVDYVDRPYMAASSRDVDPAKRELYLKLQREFNEPGSQDWKSPP